MFRPLARQHCRLANKENTVIDENRRGQAILLIEGFEWNGDFRQSSQQVFDFYREAIRESRRTTQQQ